MKREPVDFFLVRQEHQAIHGRLLNWALWGRDRRAGGRVLPMFEHYRTDGYYELQGGGKAIDSLDAIAVQKLFAQMPEKNRWAIQWHYCYPFINVGKVCRVLAVSRDGLCELVHTGRTMLKNRA